MIVSIKPLFITAIYIPASNLSQLKYPKLDLKVRIVNNLKIGTKAVHDEKHL